MTFGSSTGSIARFSKERNIQTLIQLLSRQIQFPLESMPGKTHKRKLIKGPLKSSGGIEVISSIAGKNNCLSKLLSKFPTRSKIACLNACHIRNIAREKDLGKWNPSSEIDNLSKVASGQCSSTSLTEHNGGLSDMMTILTIH